jgi:SAM-dependent MidA family methyltransferase
LSKLAEIIAKEIAACGIIPFYRFMELALYCPYYGFYEKERDNIGSRGHFFTSPSVGPLFGELLAFQFTQWFDEAEGNRIAEEPTTAKGLPTIPPLPFGRGEGRGEGSDSASSISHFPSPICYQLIEAGAHDARLAADILTWFRDHRPDLFSRLEYCIIEPSPRRRQWQEQTLADCRESMRWVTDLSALTPIPHSALCTPHFALPQAGHPAPHPSPVTRHFQVIFSNELLDAMPVHRLGWDAKAKAWFEWGVTLTAGRFEWSRMPTDSPKSKAQSPKSGPAAHAPVAPKSEAGGSRITHLSRRSQTQADHVLPSTLQLLNSPTLQLLTPHLPDGFILDICPTAEQWWQNAAHSLGCGKLLTLDYGLTAEELLAPYRTDGTLRAYHQHQLNPDILANPGEQDLTAHVNFTALQAAGESAGLTTDAFLTQEQFLTQIVAQIVKSEAQFPPWTPSRTRQFQTLTHPDMMGRPFRVLVQSRADLK